MSGEVSEKEQLRLALLAEKHAQAKALLRTCGFDCWLTFQREGSDLLLPLVMGAQGLVGTAALLIFADGPSVAIVADYDVLQFEGVFDQVIPYSLDWKEPLLSILSERNPAQIGVNYSVSDYGIDGLSHGMYLLLTETLKPLGFERRLVSSEPVSARVRAIKTPKELERMRRACQITQRIFDDVTATVRPGMTEVQIYEFMVERMRTYEVSPSWEAARCPGVSSSRSKRGHAAPTNRALERGDGLAIDFGVIYAGYASDLQRSWYFLKPGETAAPKEFEIGFDAVRDGIRLAADILKPGMIGWDIDKPVRDLVSERGYTFTHELGHQLGRRCHDGGMVLGPDNARYRASSGGTVEAGMVFTLEPCHTWVGLEEDVVVTETGCEFLLPCQEAIYLV